MNRRSLAALAALIAVPGGILTNAAVSSASPVASAAHVQAVSPAQLTDANAFADDSGGGGFSGDWCTYLVEVNPNYMDYVTIWEPSAPPCPDNP